MCQSKSEGGHRCPPTPTAKAKRKLRNEKAKAEKNGLDVSKIDERIANLDAARQKYGPIVTPMELPIPADVTKVMDDIRRQGLTPLSVGGTVRDANLPGTSVKDFDIEVYGTDIDSLARTLRRTGYRVDEVGKAFGVLKIRTSEGEDLDISVPRRDSLSGAGHRGITVDTDAHMSVEEASSRRDYTINAMMHDSQYQVCIDPHGGREDLEAKRLRHVSDAFAEDPLRPLRGFQFAGRFDMKMAPETLALSASLRSRAGELPAERIRGEFMKFYTKSSNPAASLETLRDMGWNDIVPGVSEANRDEKLGIRMQRAAAIAERDGLKGDDRVHLMAGVMAENMDEPTQREFMRYTVEGGDPGRSARGLANASISDDSDTGLRKFARELHDSRTSITYWSRKMETRDDEQSREFGRSILARAKSMGLADKPHDDILMGRHLMEESAGRKPGPWMGQTLREARLAQDEGLFSDINGALDWYRSRGK